MNQQPGDTRRKIRTAAEQLTAQGRKVTVRAVRDLVGYGSAGTISDELRQWRGADLALRAELPDASWPTLPAVLQREAEGLFLRVLGIVSEQFSAERSGQAKALLEVSAHSSHLQQALELQAEVGTAASQELLASLEDRARLSTMLQDRDLQLAAALERVTHLTNETSRLAEELASSKLESSRREVQAFARAEGLSKHLLKITEEQRAKLAAPLAALKERHDSLQTRESVLVQQLNALREECAGLRARLGVAEGTRPTTG